MLFLNEIEKGSLHLSRKQKLILRGQIKKILVNLDARWVSAASVQVCKNLTSLINEITDVEVKHILAWTCFFPGEVDLTRFITDQLDSRSIYLPRAHENKSMDFIRINDNWSDTVTRGAHGIPEPQYNLATAFDDSKSSDSAIIVPGLAFDKAGNRLGRGKGYYDRFLSKHMVNSLKIGVGFSIQCLDKVPYESHDIGLDWICNEEGFFEVKH